VVPPIRVLIVDMPRMLREIVRRSVEADTDFTVVGELDDMASVVEAAERTEAQFVVADVGVTELAGVERLLEVLPHVKLLGIARDGRQGFLYELRPQRIPLGELSPETLLDVLRVAAGLAGAGGRS
jgi:DNA-binding NarL/FixJ family response regulator